MSRMHSMNHGEMPTFEEFKVAFERECPHGTYSIIPGMVSNPILEEAAGYHTVEELWELCQRMKNDVPEDWDDLIAVEQSGERLVGDILYTLNFEWI